MKSLIFISATFASLAFSPQTLMAQTAPQMKQNHTQLVSAIDHLKVTFKQEQFKAFRKKTKVRQGTALFAKPNKFRWTFQNPTTGLEEFIFDGKTLSHYLQAEKTVTHYGVQSGLSAELRSIVNMIIDPNQLLHTYNYKEVQAKGDLTTYLLEPKNPSGSIKLLNVTFSKKAQIVTAVVINYSDGNRSTYYFSNPNLGPLTPQQFRFNNPGGIKEKRVG